MTFFENFIDFWTRDRDRRFLSRLSNLQNIYKRVRILSSTRTVEVFEALDIRENERITLWCLRWPLFPQSPEAKMFINRIRRTLSCAAQIPKVRHYGVDATGTAFVAADYLPFTDVVGPRYEKADFGPLFRDAVKQVSRLHRYQIILGDICSNSFAFNDQGRLTIANILGSIAPKDKMNSAQFLSEENGYLAPEQRAGRPALLQSDIYSLGVFLLQLATRHGFIQATTKEAHEDYLRKNLPDLLEAYSELPSWLPEILVKCLSWEVDERFRDAGELLKELNVKLSYSEKVPFRKKQIISDAAYGRDGKKAGIIEVMQEFDLLPYARPTVVAAIALIGILLFIIAYSRYNPPPPPTASAVAAVQAVGLPQDQKELTKNILEPIKKRSWNDIKQMMNEAPEHKPAAGRLHFAEKGTWERPSKPQQEPSHRASAQHFPGPYVQTPAYSPLSEAPDEQEMPLIAQRNRASETAPQSLPFSSAAHNGQIERPAHNESNTVHIRPVTRLPSYRTPVAAHRHRESNTLETPNDIDAALIAVPDGDTARLQRAAEKAISQELYAPLQQTLLEVLVRSPEATPPEVLYALAQSGAGLINYGHIQQLSGWRSPLAQYALLAACANARDSKTLDAAFIALASRGLRGYWPNLMVGEIKERYWENRRAVARAVCRFVFSDIIQTRHARESFFRLMLYFGGTLLDSGPDAALPDSIEHGPWCPVP